MAYLYGLCDERGVLRYVGCSDDPWSRYGNHTSRFAAIPMREWVSELKKRGAKPTLCVFGQVPDTERRAREEELIRAMGGVGDLLNSHDSRIRREKKMPLSAGCVLLKQTMKARGLSQQDVGRLVGCDSSNISRLLRHHRNPSIDIAIQFRNHFGIDPQSWTIPAERRAA